MDLDEESMAMRRTTEVAPLQLPCATPALTERYRMGRLLGSGGMADVFCADDLHLERAVAIKVLHDTHAMDSSGVERFRREAIAKELEEELFVRCAAFMTDQQVRTLKFRFLGLVMQARHLAVAQTSEAFHNPGRDQH